MIPEDNVPARYFPSGSAFAAKYHAASMSTVEYQKAHFHSSTPFARLLQSGFDVHGGEVTVVVLTESEDSKEDGEARAEQIRRARRRRERREQRQER